MNLFSEIQLQRANELLGMLNEDLKKTEHYQPIGVFTENDLDVYICCNKHKDVMFNVLDFEGKTPQDLSANWRIFAHIKKELNLKK